MKIILKQKPIIISIFIILTILICTALYVKNSKFASNELPVQHLEQSKKKQIDIGTYISSNHEYWNNELCWGHSENFSFQDFDKIYNEYIDQLNQVNNLINDVDLKNDFNHVKELLTEADQTNDINPLIDVHRIFHDLDVKYNNYSTSDYFGVTQYGKNH